MDCIITKRLPCSVCGLVTLRHERWFLVLENRWLDHLKILTWHSSLAREADVKSACSREHLKVLVAYWLEEASLRLVSPAHQFPVPLAGIPDRLDLELDPQSAGRVIGELSVCREPLAHGWSGSPEALESILEAIVATRNAPPASVPTTSAPAINERPRPAIRLRIADPAPRPWAGVALHQ
jgi:hypothetical protein